MMMTTTGNKSIALMLTTTTTTTEQSIIIAATTTEPSTTKTTELSTTTTESSTTTTTKEPLSAGEPEPTIISTSTTTLATTSTSTTTAPAVVYSNRNYSFWPMENNALDIISGLDGIGVNSPTYVTPGITGTGYALKLIRDRQQYINIPTYKSFVSTSFTVEMWIYPTILQDGHAFGLFSQYEVATKDYLLHMLIQGFQLSIDFWDDAVTGATALSTNTWHHVAFVYDYPSKTQTVYLNGYQDGSHSPAGPYLGMTGSINIGTILHESSNSYYDGLIDQVSLTMAAKSAGDILNDATLASWHSFDCDITYDSGPNKLQGKAVDVTPALGKVNQGLEFSKSSSYYQIPGYVLLGVASYSFSMSLWVQRTKPGGGTLVEYVDQAGTEGWCTTPLGFSSSGNIVANAYIPDNYVTGPVVPVDTWTHIAITYSQTHGLTLYVNGVSVGNTGAQTNNVPGTAVTLILGNALNSGYCGPQSISRGPFSGYLDEFRVYSRELSAVEVSVLAKGYTCTDGIMNDDETDIDCGGSCSKCTVGQKCTLTNDCANVQCINDICAIPTCTDGIKNQDETDLDCGGSTCTKRCSSEQACLSNTDCTTDNCDTTAKKCR
ncbi:unnamed protein product, partial [Adineta steineri]